MPDTAMTTFFPISECVRAVTRDINGSLGGVEGRADDTQGGVSGKADRNGGAFVCVADLVGACANGAITWTSRRLSRRRMRRSGRVRRSLPHRHLPQQRV